MIRITVSTDALARIRITYSPIWELMCSLRTLLHIPQHRLHAPWLAWATPRVDPELLDLLRGVVPSRHRFPDFLTPTPGARPQSITAELARLAATDHAVARREIECCWDGSPPPAIAGILRDRRDGVQSLATALERYWRLTVAPVWPGLRSVLTADVAYRADQLAADGLEALLNRLHPSVSFDRETLFIDLPNFDATDDAGPGGIVLVPCVFAWPGVLVVKGPVTLSYAPRGAGVVWQARKQTADHPVADLIGRSRAAILALLDLPMGTTQVAEQTDMSLPAVSQHLAVLRRSGLVTSRRVGRTILNSRTALGDALLDGLAASASRVGAARENDFIQA